MLTLEKLNNWTNITPDNRLKIQNLILRIERLEVTIENTISQLRGFEKMKGSELDMIQEYLIKSLEER